MNVEEALYGQCDESKIQSIDIKRYLPTIFIYMRLQTFFNVLDINNTSMSCTDSIKLIVSFMFQLVP